MTEAEFIEANPARSRNDSDGPIDCWICGEKVAGRVICTRHMEDWSKHSLDIVVEENTIAQWAVNHPEFNGMHPDDKYLLVNSPWIAPND